MLNGILGSMCKNHVSGKQTDQLDVQWVKEGKHSFIPQSLTNAASFQFRRLESNKIKRREAKRKEGRNSQSHFSWRVKRFQGGSLRNQEGLGFSLFRASSYWPSMSGPAHRNYGENSQGYHCCQGNNQNWQQWLNNWAQNNNEGVENTPKFSGRQN